VLHPREVEWEEAGEGRFYSLDVSIHWVEGALPGLKRKYTVQFVVN
jgi:hypothetical protein